MDEQWYTIQPIDVYSEVQVIMQSCDCHMILDIVPQHMYQGPAFLFFRFVCCVYHVCVLEVLALLSNVSVARMLYIHVCFSMCLHIHSLYQLLGHRQSSYNYKGYPLSHRARSTSHSATERSLNLTDHILSSVSSTSYSICAGLCHL